VTNALVYCSSELIKTVKSLIVPTPVGPTGLNPMKNDNQIISFHLLGLSKNYGRCHNIHHNDIQHNGTQHIDLQHNDI